MNMQRRRFIKNSIALGVACLILCTPLTSQAWGAGGHMMVAQIAFARLNPRAKAQVKALLALPINPAAISSQSKDFVNAAHWADDLRPFPEFDSFRELHFLLHNEVLEVVEDVDVRDLDQGHVVPNIGPVNFRGVWYPNLISLFNMK
jgi:hypothetical protein